MSQIPKVNNNKLTPIQQKIVNDLNNGYCLITNCDVTGATVGTAKNEYRITGRTFWQLVDKGVIYQQQRWPFDYVLSKQFINQKHNATSNE